jgi:hypothetical protein
MATKKASAPAADNSDVDEFLNDSPEIQAEDLSPEEIEKLDLTQIPPPEPSITTNLKTQTVEAPKVKGTEKAVNFNRFAGGKKPITTDLSEQMLPPVTRKTTAIYQLLGVDVGGHTTDKRIDASDNPAARIVDVSDVEKHHTYTIYDRFEENFGNRNKVVTYFEGVQRVSYKDPITGEMKADVRQKVGIPKFTRGQVVVDIMRNYHQYLWWELHPENKTNKFRDKSRAATFERVDMHQHSPNFDQIRTEIKIDAMNYVRGLSPDKAMDLAAALNIPTFREQPSAIKQALYIKAEADPEMVMFKSPNKAISVTVSIMRAMDLGIIEYDASRKQYFFAQDNNTPIWQVPLDESPVLSLAKYLIDEGSHIRDKMDEYIMYWM